MANDFIDPYTRAAIGDRIYSELELTSDPAEAIKKGQLKPYEATPVNYGGGTAISEAIKNKAAKQFASPEMLRDLQKLDFINRRADRLSRAKQLGLGQIRVDQQAQNLLQQRLSAEEAQRVGVISSILGLGGAVLGGAVGGAGGAIAGQQTGSAAGNAAL